MVPRGETLTFGFHTSFHCYVIYIYHMVSKAITIYGQTWFSRSTIWFKVNHGLYLSHPT